MQSRASGCNKMEVYRLGLRMNTFLDFSCFWHYLCNLPAIAAGYISIYLSLEATLPIAKLKICVGFSQKTILHCDI